MSWLRIRELVRKEFIQLFRDKKNRPILIIAPIIQLLIFGYVVNYDIKDIRVAFLDQSRTRESRMLMDAFRANNIFRITNLADDPQELDQLLLKGKVDLAVKVSPDFSEKIRKGDTAELQSPGRRQHEQHGLRPDRLYGLRSGPIEPPAPPGALSAAHGLWQDRCPDPDLVQSEP